MAARTLFLLAFAAALAAAGATPSARATEMTATPHAPAATPPAATHLAPPVAARHPHEVKAPFGAVRQDEYYWLRDDTRKNKDMLAYLAAENAYADAQLASSKALNATLYKEITGRIKQDDASVPYRLRGYWYYSRFETGKDYAIVARRKGEMTAPEEILHDQNAMAAGHNFFQVGDSEVSQDNRLLAWGRNARP